MSDALTPRRRAVGIFALALFVALLAGMAWVQWSAEAQGRGGKAGLEWAPPFAMLVMLLPSLAYAITLARLARGALPWRAWRVALWAGAGGVLAAAVPFALKPLARIAGMRLDFFSGLIATELSMCAMAVLAAAALALRARRPPSPHP
jgi:hypothetical protein